jgi:hypothetical protein
MAVGTHCTDHVTPFYLQKLALTLQTSGSHSVGVVRLQIKGHRVFVYYYFVKFYFNITLPSKPRLLNLFTLHINNFLLSSAGF